MRSNLTVYSPCAGVASTVTGDPSRRIAILISRSGFTAWGVDLARQAEIRETLPSLANRVPAAYQWPAEPALAGADGSRGTSA